MELEAGLTELGQPPNPSAPPPQAGVTRGRGWLGWAYLGGAFLLLVAERALVTLDTPRTLLASASGIIMVCATLLRLGIGLREPSKERRRIELGLGTAQVIGGLAIGLGVALGRSPAGTLALQLGGKWDEIWLSVLSLGWLLVTLLSLLPLLFAEFALLPMRHARHPESRRIRFAASSGLIIALGIGYVGLFVHVASERGVALDFAYFKTAKPSESTRAIVRGLAQPVRVVVVFPELNEVKNEVMGYLRPLSREGQKLNVEYVDRLLQPKIARELRVAQDGVVVLARGEARQVLTVGAEMKSARSVLRRLDQEFQKHLNKIARDPRIVYLTVGHGEVNDNKLMGETAKKRQTRVLQKWLETQNYQIKSLGLADGLSHSVPSDASLVMVLGPREPFTAEELGVLSGYLRGGGKLFLALDPEAAASSVGSAPAQGGPEVALPPSGANLSELAAVVGLSFDPALRANERSFVQRQFDKSDRTQLVTSRFSSHASVSTLSRNSGYVVLFGAGGLSKLDPEDKAVDFVVRSMAKTFADQNGNFEKEESEPSADSNFAAAITRKVEGAPAGAGKSVSEGRAFVLSDADALTDLVLENVPANRFFLLDAVRWLGGDESVAGEVSSEEDVRIEHTKDKDIVWFYTLILGVPLTVLTLGLLVARRARKKGQSA